MAVERWAITVRGVVQGVGFRPFVYRRACARGLSGFVKNRVGEVLVEAEGEGAALEGFVAELKTDAPPLARVEDVAWTACPVLASEGFVITTSDADSPGDVVIAPDTATCPACLAELFAPSDRRHRYPFLNCTDCGPRLTIIQSSPYDRPRTTMARFTMCDACRAEYDDPGDRRFHAQPTACPVCGPQLAALRPDGEPIHGVDPLACFVEAIRAGRIGALKGLGGYHLACDARDERAVRELRRRKQRDEKPLALMVRDPESAERLCHLDEQEKDLLLSPRRPIVLLRRRSPEGDGLAEGIAPGNPLLGIMLPYTPLHHLLMHDLGDAPLVMTSGNRSDEPIAYRDDDAVHRLGDIADLLLTHNRPIHVRCDDSVVRVSGGAPAPIRRSRGYAPAPLPLPVACAKPTLAVGGQFKGVFALGRGRRAFVSHHLGDLDHLEAYQAFERDIGLYEDLFDIRPERIVHDLHPDYASTAYAVRRATAEGTPRLAVQHHHAHMASCMAEHGLDEPVIGVSLDGTGYGTDGAIWGGEFLVGDYRRWRRATHLRYIRMPGGDRAVHEPWRMAVAHLADAGVSDSPHFSGVSDEQLRLVRHMLEKGFRAPWTSSTGRLFDAVAAIVGLRERVAHEGQAAMELEWLATGVEEDGAYPFEIERMAPRADSCPVPPVGWTPSAEVDVVDTRPILRAVVRDAERGVDPGVIARRFHRTMAEVVGGVCARLRAATGIATVTLSGGVFQNALLLGEASERLTADGFRVYQHRAVPANDGGLSLGQLAVAAAAP